MTLSLAVYAVFTLPASLVFYSCVYLGTMHINYLNSHFSGDFHLASCLLDYMPKAYIAVIYNHFFGNNPSKQEPIGVKFYMKTLARCHAPLQTFSALA